MSDILLIIARILFKAQEFTHEKMKNIDFKL